MGVELPEGETRVVNEVMLPPWAENAHDFVRIHNQVVSYSCISGCVYYKDDNVF